jgi:hypothetical protein
MVDINNCPTHLNGASYEFLEYGVGYREGTFENHGVPQVTYRGDYALQADMPYSSKLTVYAMGSNRGIVITITGRTDDGVTQTEFLTVNGGGTATSSLTYADVLSITAPPRDGELSFVVGETEVARMMPYETNSTRARYSLPSSDTCNEMILRLIGRPRWVAKVRDEQQMQIQNEQAITMMAAAIQLESSGKFQEAVLMEERAVKFVNDELLHKNMGNSVKINRAATGFNMSRVRGNR